MREKIQKFSGFPWAIWLITAILSYGFGVNGAMANDSSWYFKQAIFFTLLSALVFHAVLNSRVSLS